MVTDPTIEELERQLDSFDPGTRCRALRKLHELAVARGLYPEPKPIVNLHCHTFFSYNAYGYSPSKFAWLARTRGLAVAGIVDFDVLDGVDEFLEAGTLLGLRAVASIESRVYVPEFTTRVINSPGEPGIAYHMGVGFCSSKPAPDAAGFLTQMRTTAESRNRDLLARVNAYLHPVTLDYDRDVLPLTPNGNATERHLCVAFVKKAEQVFPDPGARAAFWHQKLGEAPTDPVKLQNLIRSKTMKRGGVGYVQPDCRSFPLMSEMNRFVIACGAIPTLAWLDGTSEGERDIEELLEVAIRSGVAAVNIIPDRNYTPGVRDHKLRNLYDFVERAEKLHLPVIVGTEMNAPGNKFVDAFETAELQPLVPVFLKGAYIAYGHTVLQHGSGMGYLSAWAQKNFSSTAEKNRFYEEVGRKTEPQAIHLLRNLPEDSTPDSILAKLNQLGRK